MTAGRDSTFVDSSSSHHSAVIEIGLMDKLYGTAGSSSRKTAPRIVMTSSHWSAKFFVLFSSLDLPYSDIVIGMTTKFYQPAGNSNHQTGLRIDRTAGITPQGNFILEMTATASWLWSVKSKFFNFVSNIIFKKLAVMHYISGVSLHAPHSFPTYFLTARSFTHSWIKTGKHLAMGPCDLFSSTPKQQSSNAEFLWFSAFSKERTCSGQHACTKMK